MKYLKLAPVLLAVSIGAWAQQDPRISATVVPKLDPNEVSLSRGETAKLTEFIGQAAFQVTVSNNTTNVLNRTTFTASTAVLKAGSPISAFAPFDSRVTDATITVSYPSSNPSPQCKIVGVNKDNLTCTFGGGVGSSGGTLNPGDKFEFIVLVESPTVGEQLNLNWKFGGFEGNGVGNGCCAQVDTVSTKLVDPGLPDSTAKTHVQSFVVTGTIPSVFTGLEKIATKDDPWVTIADLSSPFTVQGQVAPIPYAQSVIDEKSNTPDLSSCNPSDKNVCWKSQVSIQDPSLLGAPKAVWSSPNFLYITLQRHSSIIKGGTKLADYANGFYYSSDGVSFSPNPIPYCPGPFGGLPASGNPCLEAKVPGQPACVELPDPTKTSAFVWSCTFKAVDNGVYVRR